MNAENALGTAGVLCPFRRTNCVRYIQAARARWRRRRRCGAAQLPVMGGTNARAKFCTVQKISARCRKERAMSARSRTGLASASALATASPARLLRARARAHASTAHSARAQHACARLAGDAHALTRQHTLARQKLDVMLEALATGWPSAGWRLAHLARARCANASPPPLLARPMRHPHALPAIHHRCCHRVLRDHDDERDEDQRDDAEDREHDGRRERVRAARVCGSHSRKRTREHATREHLSKAKPPSKNACAGGR